MSDVFSVEGKVVVVTAGAGVLCRALAESLAERGAKVAVLDLKGEEAQKVVDQIHAHGGKAIALTCNALERESLEACERAVVEQLGPVDILINGVGGNDKRATTTPQTSLFALSLEGVDFVFKLNFEGPFLTTQVFARAMAERKNGVVLNIASMNAFRPLTRIPAYSAAKAAIMNFTQWLAVHMAQEYGPGLRVNAIAPGFFLTDQNRFLLKDEGGTLTPRGQSIISHTPLGRFGEPLDLLGAVLLLVSDAGRFITGTTIPVDGGFNAYSGV